MAWPNSIFRYGFPLLLLALVLYSSDMSAQQECVLRLSGQVINQQTGEPLPYANILIKEHQLGAVADEHGRYTIENLCAGDYTVICTRVDCHHSEHQITIDQPEVRYDFRLLEHSVELTTIEVRAAALPRITASPEDQLTGVDLAARQGLSLGQSLERLPGVHTLKTGSSIAKPILQGMHGNRVLLLNNGVRLEGQQWGLEHAPEIDPFVADKLTVIRGAGGLRYGPDALGGVIRVEPRKLPTAAGWQGAVQTAAFSQGRTATASGMLEGRLGEKIPLSGRIQGTLKRGGNKHTPDYFLDNTGVSERNFSWALGLDQPGWSAEAYYSSFFSELGIFSGAHIGNLTDLQNAIDRGRPLQDGSFSYTLGRPLQRIAHELFKARVSLITGKSGKLHVQYARQFNRRQEFDAHSGYEELPDDIQDPNIEFEITTHNVDINWQHQLVAGLRGEVGVQLLQQVNTTDRGALIPNFENRTAGAYWIERWRRSSSPLELEAGLRYDARWLDISTQGRDSIGEQRNFDRFSGTIGAIYRQPYGRLRLNVGTAWRAPHVNELYSYGVHHGSASFEAGDPNLQSEQAINTSLTAEWTPPQRPWQVHLTAYYNVIQKYIFLEPQAQPVLTIRGAFPAFAYAQADARIMGLDGAFHWTPHRNWQWSLQGSLLRGWNRELADYLVFMPADQLRSTWRYGRQDIEVSEAAPFVSFSLIRGFRQQRTPAAGDYAPAPPAYWLAELEAGFTWQVGQQPVHLGLAVFNLTNTRYREYLNRFRYFADEVGRNVSLRVKVPFALGRRAGERD